jgi:hypothetical protein
MRICDTDHGWPGPVAASSEQEAALHRSGRLTPTARAYPPAPQERPPCSNRGAASEEPHIRSSAEGRLNNMNVSGVDLVDWRADR